MKINEYKKYFFLFYILLTSNGFWSCQSNSDNHFRRDQKVGKENNYSGNKSDKNSNYTRLDTAITANHPDHDFVHFMISQHNMAINLANEEIKNGQNKALKEVANHIINHHSEEKTFLDKAAARIDKEKEDERVASVLHQKLKMGIDAMSKQLKAVEQIESLDAKFKAQIIINHQTSIDVAEAYLRFGLDPELKNYAGRLIKDHSAEIMQLQK
ncbi:DUF305 domain-containing protein [Adhaeribacter aquaticus]|uniref:DUF305 domain-containing protein n=1 Tax=Adhaeribacter aquaticus TaxID=299567 RepID=UPI000409B5DD|nr:DUF305 domain-containing protein [Adhaeribacter aquaticus]